MKKLLALALCILATGCASVAPHGTGRFLQIKAKNGEVLAEMDTVAAAHMSCQQQAALHRHPNVDVVCSETSTPQKFLPYWYVAHQRADHYLRSSPYAMRAASPLVCNAALRADRATEGMVILENHCK